jgi:peptidoglycan/LPS O-acetylase OafA/YrhL
VTLGRVLTRRAVSDIPTRDRLPSLTGLRFWAALLVVLYHLSSYIGEVQPLGWMVMFGRTGVTFFFVLSGFVLAWTYLDRPTRFEVFLWRRFARLWPLVAATGILSLAVFALVGRPVPAWQAATTFLFLQAWHPDWSVGANGAAWSLSDEAFFYVLFPLVLALAVKRRQVLWAAVALGIPVLWLVSAAAGWSAWTLDYFPVPRLIQFALGVACAVAMRRGRQAPVGYWFAVLLVIAFHAVLPLWDALADSLPIGLNPMTGSQWWSAPAFALLIMAAADHDRAGRWTGVQGPWSLRLGHWSFAWYLVHEIAIRLWVYKFGGLQHGHLITAVEWVVLLALTLGSAAVLYAYVEHPAERWLRRRGPQDRADETGQPSAS